MAKPGFTLIELILVIALMGLLGLGTLPFSSNLLSRNAVDSKTNELYSFVKTAQLNSMLGKANSSWGVAINNGVLYLFKGNSFAERDLAFDQKITLPSTITITEAELVFNRVNGELNQEYQLTVSSQLKTKTVSITRLGVVNVN